MCIFAGTMLFAFTNVHLHSGCLRMSQGQVVCRTILSSFKTSCIRYYIPSYSRSDPSSLTVV